MFGSVSRLCELTMLAVGVIAGVLFVLGVGRADGDPGGGQADGCYLNSCKNVITSIECTSGNGFLYSLLTCDPCTVQGQCDTGSNDSSGDLCVNVIGGRMIMVATCTATYTCSCMFPYAPPNALSPSTVEAQGGTVTSPFIAAGMQKSCGGLPPS